MMVERVLSCCCCSHDVIKYGAVSEDKNTNILSEPKSYDHV